MIKIICVGKIKEKYLTDLINDYYKRINKYHKLEIIELKDSDIKREREDILKYLKKTDYIISLCIEGKNLSTLEFKDKIENLLCIESESKTRIGGM